MNALRTLSLLILCGMSGLASAQDFRVTLLGSGENYPQPDRLGPSVLVEAGDRTFVFDAGRGVLQRFIESGASFADVDAVFLTHLHSDHVIGFPGLWLGGWLFSGRDQPLRVFGPAGTANMVEHLTQAFSFDIGIRIEDDRASPEGVRVEVVEVEDGYVWRDGDVKIRAIEVDHRPIKPAFGYRIDYAGRSAVLSGDTRFSEALIEAAEGADLLIHEVAAASNPFLAGNPRFRDGVMAHHTNAEEAGRVFSRVSPKLAVYAHMVTRDLTTVELVEKTRATYAGPLIVGEDLMMFDIGESVTVVTRPSVLRQ